MITVVTGAPCSGKSTYVAENAKSGDAIIDMDVLALALTTPDVKPFEYDSKIRSIAIAARQAAVKEALTVAQGERYFGVWIIHSDPSHSIRSAYRAMGARFVEMDPGKDVCLTRLAERPDAHSQLARSVIEGYYAKR
jgi:hypothetical protein